VEGSHKSLMSVLEGGSTFPLRVETRRRIMGQTLISLMERTISFMTVIRLSRASRTFLVIWEETAMKQARKIGRIEEKSEDADPVIPAAA
jgi:hypothetical protein